MISVITPTYNCANFIGRSYACLLAQSYNDWEWIVVDDGSTDNTRELFKVLCEKDTRIKYFKLPNNKGRGFARNHALKMSQGETLVIWDIDDLYTSDRLAEINKAMQLGFDYFCSYVLLVDNDLNLKGARHFYQPQLLNPSFVHATLGFRSSIVEKYKLGYDTTMRAGEDLEIMLRIGMLGKGYYCKKYLMIYVEDREVNLPKAIQANKSHLKVLHKMLSDENIDIKTHRKIKILTKGYIKLLALYSLYANRSLYPQTVKLRNSEIIKSKLITSEITQLLKG